MATIIIVERNWANLGSGYMKANFFKNRPTSENSTGGPAVEFRFEDIYNDHFAFVWRSVKRLGVRESMDDVVQQVFIIVYRKLGDFEGRSSIKTWLYSITRRVVKDHFRTLKRKPRGEPLYDVPADNSQLDPSELASRISAHKTLTTILDSLDEEKREVFILAELEEMTVPEIAQTLEINTNTAYSRLRAGRQAFNKEVERHLARENRSS